MAVQVWVGNVVGFGIPVAHQALGKHPCVLSCGVLSRTPFKDEEMETQATPQQPSSTWPKPLCLCAVSFGGSGAQVGEPRRQLGPRPWVYPERGLPLPVWTELGRYACP